MGAAGQYPYDAADALGTSLFGERADAGAGPGGGLDDGVQSAGPCAGLADLAGVAGEDATRHPIRRPPCHLGKNLARTVSARRLLGLFRRSRLRVRTRW